MLVPIDDTNFDHTVKLLVEGFPERSEEFWRDGLTRAQRYSAKDSEWPVGFLMVQADRFVGVILTLTSRARDGNGADKLTVNLSSWYVQPGSRAAAPMMLMKVLAHGSALFTDLTPIASVAALLRRLDFTQWSEGRLVISWPQALIAGSSGSTVAPLSEIPRDALDRASTELLADHAALGCLCAGLYDGIEWQPLIFIHKRLAGLTNAYLIYTRSRREALKHRQAISKFLLRRGIPLFSLDADRTDRPAGAIFVARPLNKFFRGDTPKDRIDYAYSELVYFSLG